MEKTQANTTSSSCNFLPEFQALLHRRMGEFERALGRGDDLDVSVERLFEWVTEQLKAVHVTEALRAICPTKTPETLTGTHQEKSPLNCSHGHPTSASALSSLSLSSGVSSTCSCCHSAGYRRREWKRPPAKMQFNSKTNASFFNRYYSPEFFEEIIEQKGDQTVTVIRYLHPNAEDSLTTNQKKF